MKIKIHQVINTNLVLLILITIMFSACKKEFPSYPYSEIQSFSFKNKKGEIIQGVINNKEIIVYWPEDQPLPETISPEIHTSERASVTPSSGTSVAFNNGTRFIVTAQDGSKTEYQLRPVVNRVKPSISRVTTGFFNGKYILLPNNITGHPGLSTGLSIDGDFFNNDVSKSKVFFVKADGSEVEGVIENIRTINIGISTDKIGKYKGIRLLNSGYSISFSIDFEVVAPFIPYFISAAPDGYLTAKAGGEVTLKGQVLDKITAVEIYDLDYNLVPLKIKEKKSEEITVIIPSGLPVGDYGNGIQLQVKDGNYLGVIDPSQPLLDFNVSLRITP
jgi:hypothetical protein